MSSKQDASGKIYFLPWVTLPASVSLGGFKFAPILTDDPSSVVGIEIGPSIRESLARYIDLRGKAIKSCTVILRPRSSRIWSIPDSKWDQAFGASRMLALAAMTEQRFFEQMSPHLNASIFRPVVQGIAPKSDRIALFIGRRGGGLTVGGLRHKDVVFQMPMQAYDTRCPPFSLPFCKALDGARRGKAAAWAAIEASLPLFLLGQGESSELPTEACAMLCAIAFERLLDPPDSRTGALSLSSEFAKMWQPYGQTTLKQAKRVRSDNNKHGDDQKVWFIHQKWMKELYEARSSLAHRGAHAELNQNWKPWQHLIIAAFVYPLVVKHRLAKEGLYVLSDEEHGACDALDELLDSDWGSGWRRPPEWPKILSEKEYSRGLRAAMEKALKETP